MKPVNPNMEATFPPPVMEARRWVECKDFPASRPLMNLSQAAPVDPPPEGLMQAMADAVLSDPSVHLYGSVLGHDALRAELAAQWSASYGGVIEPSQVAITSGCNQAFTSVMSTIAQAGDEVIVPLPFYFNHQMWLDMQGVRAAYITTGDDLLPDPERAASLITPRTKAIVLVSPNNPAGVEYPPALLAAFRDLARARDLVLIVDETYRDFHSSEGAPHALFEDPDWDDTFIHLYSFSKAYRLTGHRVGAIMASPARLAEVEKFLDTVAICPPQIGQVGALWGMQNLRDWLAGERLEILARRDAVRQSFARLPEWELLGSGAYFAYVRHPFDMPSDEVAKRLVDAAHLLVLPGTMFGPTRAQGGAGQAEATLRVAFANADRAGLDELANRLAPITSL
ncbi:aminotransferase [Gymnodinialimonas ceratoperidinii]|uniref:Aminotransferase n=1 Tax=Gymnodinialimonas ceratoperidinii TaxID=2856823 RepID=A0A8F6TTK5_9RHOB|nr:aminotransferase [Gymnodinialimonas ceratoperidinii]QXT38696.1 aminotransferase [Gymnodinialimonas ceratoperidinii]